MSTFFSQNHQPEPESDAMNSIFIPNLQIPSLTPFGPSEYQRRIEAMGGFPEPSSTLEISISPGNIEHFKNWDVLYRLANKKELRSPHSRRYILGAAFPSMLYMYFRGYRFYDVEKHLVTRASITSERRFVREVCPPLEILMRFMEPLKQSELPSIFDPARRDEEVAHRGDKWGVLKGIDNRVISVPIVELTDDEWAEFILEANSPVTARRPRCVSAFRASSAYSSWLRDFGEAHSLAAIR